MNKGIIAGVVGSVLLALPAHADATADLWTALKGANDAAALAAIAKGVDVNNLDPIFGTPLNYAACFAGSDVIKALIAAKSNVNYVAATTNTPLINALTWGNTEAAKVLLAAGANAKAIHVAGNTLTAAMMGGKLELVKLVLDAGVSPNDKYKLAGNDATALVGAMTAYSPKDKVAKLAKDRGNLAKLGITYPAWLANAKESDFSPQEEVIALLIERGADPNSQVLGGSALLTSALTGKTGVVKALIATGKVDLNQRNPAGRTALWLAAEKGYVELANALIAAKVNLELEGNARGGTGWHELSPLMVAALNGHTAVVESLCKAGANVNKVSVQKGSSKEYLGDVVYTTLTTEKNTALSLAASNKKDATVAVLKTFGAKGPSEL